MPKNESGGIPPDPGQPLRARTTHPSATSTLEHRSVECEVKFLGVGQFKVIFQRLRAQLTRKS